MSKMPAKDTAAKADKNRIPDGRGPAKSVMKATLKTELQILSEIGRISNSSASLTEKLQQTVEAVARGMGKEGASVFLLDRSGATVTLAAAIGLNQETIGKLSFPLGMGIAGWVAEQKVPLALEDPFSDPRFQYVPETGIERFKSLSAAPIMDESRCLGVIFVLSATPWNASASDITLLTTTANQISGVIQNARLLDDLQGRLSELGTIYDIGMALTSTLDFEELLALIAKNATQALQAKGCAIRLLNLPVTRASGFAASYSLIDDTVKEVDATIGEAIARKTAEDKKPLLIRDLSLDTSFENTAALTPTSIISVPLIFHNKVNGIITLYNKESGQPFYEDDLQFLSTIASGAAVALENAAMYERMEELATDTRTRAEKLSILYDIGNAMSTTLDLDKLLRIILTAATMGSGLAFNRAVLLLTNDRTNTLQGMMGVGPRDWEEAEKAWTAVSSRRASLLDWIETGEPFKNTDREFNDLAKGIRVILEPDNGILALTVLEKKPYNIEDAPSCPLVNRELCELLGLASFATVPLVAKGRAIGAILVDNLFTKRQITDRDIRYLTMFANQAALAIENAIIHSNLETLSKDMLTMQQRIVQSERMAALGTMMAEITHEIRNPVISIAGFARRLVKKIESEDTKKYIDIILSEALRLEGIINDNLSYIKDVTPQSQEVDINAVTGEILALYEDELAQRKITLTKDLSPSLQPLWVDPQHIRQALINLITNAMEAMAEGGSLFVRTYPVPNGQATVIEISDTGLGISGEAMGNIFNPYYTTKAQGTGLGLPITQRIIKAHGGTIKARNRKTGGTVFTIRLPADGNKNGTGDEKVTKNG